jgi:peptidoglycan biosynthesis protein MviN/MurJ (putative lipid II flippase)
MQKYSFVGIALGSSIASWYSVYLFVKYAKKHGYFVLNRSLIAFIIKLFFCAFICSISMWFVFEFLEEMFSSNNILDRIIRVSGSLSVGFGLYIAAAFFAGILSKKMIMGLVRR